MNGKQLKNSILQWAIQGKLVPQDPNDEPASVLLEKIRQEKERLIKEKKIKRDKNASIIYRGEDNSYYEKMLATGEVKCIDDEIPFEIPQGWEWCRLLDIGKTETGTTPLKSHPEYFGDYIPFLGPANILNSQITSVTQGLSELGVDYGRVVPKNTILQVCIGGSIGKCAITHKSVTFNQQINSITPYLCNVEFVHIILQSEYFRLAIMDKATGTATPIINRGNWETLLFPLPPISEQKRIVTKIKELTHLLNVYSKKQEELNTLNTNINQCMKKSILQEAIQGRLVPQIVKEGTAKELLEQIKSEKQKLVKEGKLKKSALATSVIFRGDDNKYWEKLGQAIKNVDEEIPFDVPDRWKWCRLGTLFSHCTGKALNAANQKGTLMTYITTSNLYWNRFELNNLKQMRFTDEEIEKCTAITGDLLVCEGGDIGRAAIWNYQYDIRIQNHIHKLRAYIPLCTKFFFWIFYFYKSAGLIGGKGIGIQGLSSKALDHILIPLPPLEEQYRIVAKIEEVTSIMS